MNANESECISFLASEASPFHLILPKSTLAKALCDAFDRYIKMHVNNVKKENVKTLINLQNECD